MTEKIEYISTISANTLFHFTDSAKNILGILTSTFHPAYHLEPFFRGDQKALAIPMVSFCDLPLSQIKKHLKFYGNYGIGLSKKWGEREGINPVFYCHSNAHILKDFRKILEFTREKMLPIKTTENKEVELSTIVEENKNLVLKVELLKILASCCSTLKPYKGKMYKKGEIVENVKFYDEREWRFVPESENLSILLTEEQFKDKVKTEGYNAELAEKNKLTFEPEDIRYIIVEKESEILSMVENIHRIKAIYNEDTRTLLTTKIISAEQILEDF